MPLVELVTDLKSLKYGKDTPGGGYSGQPYIQAKIPDGLSPKSPDFLLRNGYLAPLDTAEDIKRLGKMFFDLKSFNGAGFIAKQLVLSNSAVRTQTSGVLNEGIYTPLNTLAQAGVVTFGGHLNKQGINPFEQTGAYAQGDYLYYNKITQYNLDWLTSSGATALDNRLFALYQSRILNNEIGGYAKPNNINVDLKNTLLTYRGGPGSILGVGQTDIRFEDNGNKRTGANNVQLRNIGFFGRPTITQIPGTSISIETLETPDNPAAGNFSVFKRPNSRTTGLFITPYGVTDAYESATGVLLPQGPNGAGVIRSNGGYTFEPSFYYNVYNTGSLTPYNPVVKSQKILQSINIDNKQVGGLQVDTGNGTKGWIKGGLYFNGNAETRYFVDDVNFPDGLPSNNVNTPQITSLDPKFLTSGSRILKSVLDDKQQGGLKINEETRPWFKSNEYDLPRTNVNTPQSSSFAESNTGQDVGENVYTYNKTLIKSSNVNPPSGNHSSPKIQDFRKILRASLRGEQQEAATLSGATPFSLEYSGPNAQNIEKRVNLGDPGARANNDYSSYTAGVEGPGRTGQPLDRINALKVYSSNSGPRTGPEYTDLITFRIGAINNYQPNSVDYIHFRAFIDSFTDSYTGDWSGYNYLGRGEKFYTYNGFDRKISLSFKVAAQSKEELIPMYKKLNFLASNLAPDYSGEYGYMKGCFITLTVGGYLYEQPGFITNLSYDMITEMPWEIGINDTNGAQDPTVKQLSHMVKVGSFDFTPIHNFIPAKQAVGLDENRETLIGDEEYIALANPNNGSTNWSGFKSVNAP